MNLIKKNLLNSLLMPHIESAFIVDAGLLTKWLKAEAILTRERKA